MAETMTTMSATGQPCEKPRVAAVCKLMQATDANKKKNLKRRAQRKQKRKREVSEDSRPWWPVDLLQRKMGRSDAGINVSLNVTESVWWASFCCPAGITHKVAGTTEKRAKHNVAAVCLNDCYDVPFRRYFDANYMAFMAKEPFRLTARPEYLPCVEVPSLPTDINTMKHYPAVLPAFNPLSPQRVFPGHMHVSHSPVTLPSSTIRVEAHTLFPLLPTSRHVALDTETPGPINRRGGSDSDDDGVSASATSSAPHLASSTAKSSQVSPVNAQLSIESGVTVYSALSPHFSTPIRLGTTRRPLSATRVVYGPSSFGSMTEIHAGHSSSVSMGSQTDGKKEREAELKSQIRGEFAQFEHPAFNENMGDIVDFHYKIDSGQLNAFSGRTLDMFSNLVCNKKAMLAKSERQREASIKALHRENSHLDFSHN